MTKLFGDKMGVKGETPMCEPSHSINQFPDNDDYGPMQPRIDAASKKSPKKGLFEWAKKILGRLHYSKFGAGHSEGMWMGRDGFRMLPEPTRYEAHWWNRTVILDGSFNDSRFVGNFKALEFERAQALEAATEYANRSSIGSLSALRRFLETSIVQTVRSPALYLDAIIDKMIVPKYRDKAMNRIKGALGVKKLNAGFWYGWQLPDELSQDPMVNKKLAKLAVGFTRQRGILVPCWADDSDLWTPKNA